MQKVPTWMKIVCLKKEPAMFGKSLKRDNRPATDIIDEAIRYSQPGRCDCRSIG